jgi:hypothetical protein
VERVLAGETEMLGENLFWCPSVHLKSNMTWEGTRAAAVGSRWLIAWELLWWRFFFFFLTLVCEAIGTAATPGLLCQPRVIVKMIVEKQMKCRLSGETEVLGENLPQRHFCPSQNPTWPDPGLNRAAAVGSRRLTAWAMARPCDGVAGTSWNEVVLRMYT